MLLVTADAALRDDVALLAAVVGARLETCAEWTHVSSQEWVAVLCGPDAPPSETMPRVRSEVLLVTPEHIAVDAWALAARHPRLRPVPLPAGEQWLVDHLAAQIMDRLPGRVLVVLGAVGGVGASTVAYLAAAEAAARRMRVLLLDGELSAGSGLRALRDQALRAGVLEGPPSALDWTELDRHDGPLSSAQLIGALPMVDGISLITGEPRADGGVPDAMAAVVTAARRAADLVVVDAGRRPDVVDSLGGPPEAGLLVTEPSPRGGSAVAELPLRGHDVDWSLVVTGPSRGGATPAELARRLGVPLAADLAEQRWLRRAGTIGAAYDLLRSRRGALFAGGLLAAAGVEAGGDRGG
ncbi:hypothetical protein GCM10027061_23910 [Nesterenkonia suensis]